MSSPRVRFRPPRAEPSAEVRWVLARAFGPAAGTAPAADGAAAVELARRLGLSPRIASRVAAERLAAEVGAGPAEALRRDRLTTAAAGLRLAELAGEVAELAAAAAVPLAFLKFMALELAGRLAPGSRPAADLDVLVPPAAARPFQAALEARGCRPSAVGEMEHQQPALVHPAGGVIEVHRALPGVRAAAGGGWATLPELAAAGLLEPAPGTASALLPRPPVLAAHALVHALAQHGFAPHAYPAWRMVADLADLGWGEDAEVVAVTPLVAGTLTADEVAAAASLCRRLARGDGELLAEDPAAGGEAALLHHLLAGVLDPDYRLALRLPMVAHPLSEAPPVAGALLSLARALFPSRGELAALYGAPASALGYWRLRLFRPFDLARRGLRYGAGARRLAGRRRGGGR
jgi:Uncharacterised nucleotidyltransferase